MSALDDRRRLEELYPPSADDFVMVDVPDPQFVMIDGEGDHEGEAFALAFRWLFAPIHPIKRLAKGADGQTLRRAAPRMPVVGRRDGPTSYWGTERGSGGDR